MRLEFQPQKGTKGAEKETKFAPSAPSPPSSRRRFAVNRLGNHGGRETFSADFDSDGCARLRELRWHVSHADAEAQRRALGAADDFADGFCPVACAPGRVIRPGWGAFVGHFERDALLADHFFLLFGQDRTADKLALVERDEESEAGLDRGGGFVEFVAVEGIAHLGSQGVARAEAARFEAEGLTAFQDFVPDRLDGSRRGNDFKTVFAGVAGAGDVDHRVTELEKVEIVLLQAGSGRRDGLGARWPGKTAVDELLHARALDGDRPEGVRDILEFDTAAACACGVLVPEPGDVLFNARGIDDEQEVEGPDAISVEVVDGPSAFVAHEGVL